MFGIRNRFLTTCLATLMIASVLGPWPGAEAKVRHEILYAQTASSTVGGVSQDFEFSLNEYDTKLADDFQIPRGQSWVISEVRVQGFYGGSGARTAEWVDVEFFRADANFGVKYPAPISRVQRYEVIPDSGLSSGAFVLRLDPPVLLIGGAGTPRDRRAWLMVQARLDFGGDNRLWAWRGVPHSRGSPTSFRNLGDGFGTGCEGWKWYHDCSGTEARDQLFRLTGDRRCADATLQSKYLEDTRNHVVGGSRRDKLVGTGGRDVLCGWTRNDVLKGRGGRDLLLGGGGSDTLVGGGGKDVLRGDDRGFDPDPAGKDLLKGGAGDDKLIGGPGRDTLKGGAGNDKLKGGPGRDKLKGGAGNDKLKGGPGRDVLVGGPGRDTCIGGGGKDVFRGCERIRQ